MNILKISAGIKGITVLVVVLALLGVGYTIYEHAPDKKTIMTITYSGGMCSDGGCTTNHNIYSTGEFEDHTSLSSSEASELQRVIDKTDFLQFSGDPSPTCPSYADGRDISLSFPEKYENKKFKLCELEISDDNPALTYILDLIERHSSD